MHYGGIDAERDMPAVARLITHAFAGTAEGSAEWIRAAGPEHVRALRPSPGEPPLACLLRIPMGQYFGGRSIPMLGIAGVAVAPEARGRGLADRLMRECILEAKRDGFPLSCLYASTQSLYRKAGYEQAGHRFLTRIPLAQIGLRERAAPILPLAPSDHGRVRACYAAFAPRFSGALDRGPYCWNRVESLRDERYTGFGVASAAGGALDGYVYFTQRRKPDTGRHDVVLTDLAYLTPDAGRRLLGFLADFATVGDDLVLPGAPHHPLLGLLPQQRYAIAFKDYWMLRVVDAAAALEARGYAPGITLESHLEIRDDTVPENSRRIVLRIENGRGAVTDGGRAEIVVDARALAAAFTGLHTPRALTLMGGITGDDRSLDNLGAALAGGTPWMTDFF